jgi:hypothetical protein
MQFDNIYNKTKELEDSKISTEVISRHTFAVTKRTDKNIPIQISK